MLPIQHGIIAAGGITTGDGRRPRIALYSHDTQGLGHVRRNLLIARALSQKGQSPIILLLSGVHEAAGFAMPDGVDCLTLPSLGKDAQGAYFPRSLGVSMSELISLRSRTINVALRSFQPDVLVVDKVPLGAFDELASSLTALRAASRTRVVLGLREILDDPETVRREWREGRYEQAIRKHYDRLWIYGDPKVYDAVREYGFPADIAARARYTGYLDPYDPVIEDAPAAAPAADVDLPAGRLLLCVVGGGRDGMPLAESFARARFPEGTAGLLVTGPLMPVEARARLRRLAARRPSLRIVEFVTDPTPFMRRAEAIVAMGGYNTTCEVASVGTRALIVPRTEPRTEQLIRAERLARLGIVDMLHPDDLTPGAVSRWLHGGRTATPAARDVIDLDGASRLPTLLDDVLRADRISEDPLHATA